MPKPVGALVDVVEVRARVSKAEVRVVVAEAKVTQLQERLQEERELRVALATSKAFYKTRVARLEPALALMDHMAAAMEASDKERVAAADRAVEAAVALKLAERRASAAEEAAAAAERRAVELEDFRDQLRLAVEDVKFYRELEDEDLLRHVEWELDVLLGLLEEDEDYGD